MLCRAAAESVVHRGDQLVDGDLVVAQTLRYLDERKEFYDRWVGTLTNFRTAPLSI